MQRRLPKIGFRSKLAKDCAEVLLYQLDQLPAGEIDFAALRAAKLVPQHRQAGQDRRQGRSDQGVRAQGHRCDRRRQGRDRSGRRQAWRSKNGMARSAGALAGLVAGWASSPNFAQRLLFVVGALIVYRIGCYIPVPGVNPEAMLQLMESQKGTIVDMFNMFSGGALAAFQPVRAERDAVHLGVDRDAADGADPAQPEGDAEGRRVRPSQDHPVLAHGRGVPGGVPGRRHRDRAAGAGCAAAASRWSTTRASASC